MSSQGSSGCGSRGGGGGMGGRGRAIGGGGPRGRAASSSASLSSSCAASATAHARARAGYASSYVVPKARNPANQPLLESLAESRSKIDPARNKFAMTLKTAMDNLAKHPDAVNSYRAACQVRGIGKKIAQMLFPTDDIEDNSSNSKDEFDEGGGGSHAAAGRRAGGIAGSYGNVSGKTTIDGEGGGAAIAEASRKRMRQATLSESALFSAAAAAAASSSTANAAAIGPSTPQGSAAVASSAPSSAASTPTRRQLQYHKEASKSAHQLWKNQNLVWNVLFVVDNREKKDGRDRLCDKFSSANIPFEVRQLPIGDMTWIAQGRRRRNQQQQQQQRSNNANDNSNDNSSPTKGPVVVELVLGTLIERKTLADLKASIHGTRYAEQRMRMAQTGLSQCVLLVEGNLHREAAASECHNKFMDACHTALWETCLYMNFQIVRTADMGETIGTLKLMHRRILQRSFPQAFSSEVLPTFGDPGGSNGSERGRDGRAAASDSFRDPQRQDAMEAGQRKRRRYQSLHKLVFDTEPVLPPGMDRFVTYNEFKAKVGRDREAGLRTVRMVHGAMVKQVPKIENKKAAAIVHAYPTPALLLDAYHRLSTEQDKQLLLRDLDTSAGDARPTQRKCTVGMDASKQMYVAYGMSKAASERPSYAEQVERVQEQQRRSSSSSGSSGAGSGEKRPAPSSRGNRLSSSSFLENSDSLRLSQASEASSCVGAAAASVPFVRPLDAELEGMRGQSMEHPPRTYKAPPMESASAMMTMKKPPPIPPSAASRRPAALPPATRKPPPAGSDPTAYRRSQSQESSALGSSQESGASSSSRGALAGRRPGRDVAASSASASLSAAPSSAAGPVRASSDEAVIDLCDDGSSSSSEDDNDAFRGNRRAPNEDDTGGRGHTADEGADDDDDDDDDDDYNYSPVVKTPASTIGTIREPLLSLPNGLPPHASSAATATSETSEARRPVVNPYASARKNRHSLGSLSVSSSSSSSSLSAAPGVASAAARAPAVNPLGKKRRAPLTLTELGLGSSSSDDDDNEDDNDMVRCRTDTKPAPRVVLPPRRKAREPEVYEILSD